MMRKYRNAWVHIKSPWDDRIPLEQEATLDNELAEKAELAIDLLKQVIYWNQWI